MPRAIAAERLSKTPSSPVSSYVHLFRSEPVERIQLAKKGVAASEAKRIIGKIAPTREKGFAALNLSPATVNRKASQGKSLSPDESERVIGVARLIGQIETMIEQSGDPTGFDAAAWLSRWLDEPLPAFGGRRPIEFLDTMEGQALVANILARMQSGAYA